MRPLLQTFLLTFVLCSQTPKLNEGPPQAPSFNPGGNGKTDRLVFEKYEHDVGIRYNRFIPSPKPNFLRVATWNTHMLIDLKEELSVVSAIIDDLKEIGADVLVTEEIPLEGERLETFESGLNSLGYRHRALRSSNEEGAALGIMIASKLPIKSVEFFELGFKRICLDVGLSGGIHVLGTHLEVTSATVRHDQTERILAHLIDRGFYNGSFVLAGDFNSQYISDDVAPLRESVRLTESFRGLNWTHPEYTCWSGAEIDFVFVGLKMNEMLSGAYIYHSATSDHLPVIIDINTGNSAGFTDSSTGDSLKLLAFIIFLALLIYVLALKFLPRNAWNNAYRVLRDFETM